MDLLSEKRGDVMIVAMPEGVLDAGNSKEFKREIEPILNGNKRIVFDLSRLQFMDSSGVGAILSCLRKLNSEGGDLKLCAMNKSVRVLFELIRMHKIFDI